MAYYNNYTNDPQEDWDEPTLEEGICTECESEDSFETPKLTTDYVCRNCFTKF